MKRRDFITLLGGAVAVSPLSARAEQSGRVPRIGILNPGQSDTPAAGGFYKGLQDLGYIERQNLDIERRYAEWNSDRFSQLAAELVQLKVDVIVVMSTSPARAVKEATSTIPIVVAGMADPVGDELITSLARPGGNITGTTFLGPELTAKRFGLLKQTIPGLTNVAALYHSNAYGERTMQNLLKATEAAAASLGLKLQIVPVKSPNDFDDAFAVISAKQVEAIIVSPSPMLFTEHRRIVELAAEKRLPGIYAAREFAEAGGLMAYGANLTDVFRLAAIDVDKILKGARPAELPVEQPTKFELVINSKTAKTLGLAIPPGVFAIADEVLE
jgi:putative tryptophan/tyrosine transport system substrate-binding protein